MSSLSLYRSRLVGIAVVFASNFLGLCSLFIFFPLVLINMKQLGYSDSVVGMVAAAEWLGLAVATPFVSRWVEWLGLRPAFLLSNLLSIASFLVITFTPWPLLWAATTVVSGAAGCLRWIVAESTVAELATDQYRGQTMGAFGTLISASYMLGPAILGAIGTEGSQVMQAQLTALALAAVGLLLGTAMAPVAPNPDKLSAHAPRIGLSGLLDAMRVAPILVVSGLFGGFYDAGSTGLLPLFGLSMQMKGDVAALLISACGLGGVLTMWPTGVLADRFSHRRLYIACGWVALLSSAAMPLVLWWHPLAFLIALAWGGCGGAAYTLAMVDAGSRGTGVELVNFTTTLVLSYTVGGMLAPLFGGFTLSLAPFWGLPILMTGFAALVTVALYRHKAD